MTAVIEGTMSAGHPVDVATGNLFHLFDDHLLQGQFPLPFGRRYSGALLNSAGMFGKGWSSPFEMRLQINIDGLELSVGNGESKIAFDETGNAMSSGGIIRNLGAFHELRREGKNSVVTRWHPKFQDIVRFVFLPFSGAEVSRLERIENLHGRGIEVNYDGLGRIIGLRQLREDRGYGLVYDEVGRVIEVRVRSTEINVSRRQRNDPKERIILRYSYGADGRLAELVDAVGNTAKYFYDEVGRLSRDVTFGGTEYRFRYDDKGRCIETTGPDGFGFTALSFHDAVQLTKVTNSVGDVTTYYWNSRGQVERCETPSGLTSANTYDSVGRIIQAVNQRGGITAHEYTDRGDVALVTSPTGKVIRYEYDEWHQVTAVVDPSGNQWHWERDERGRPMKFIDPLGATTTYAYDGKGDVIEKTDPLGHKWRFEWDAIGSLTCFSDPRGNRSYYEYDSEGRLLAALDPLGNRTVVTLDNLGRVREIHFPDGSTQKFRWDHYGQISEFVDERGGVHGWRYGICGQPIEMVNTLGEMIRWEWSKIPGQLLAVYNPLGERHTFDYDADGRIVKETDFAGRTMRHHHHAHDSSTLIEDANGHASKYYWGVDGALAKIEFDDGSKSEFVYDERGLLIKAVSGDCPVERGYDEIGRLAWEKQGACTISFEYDAACNRIHRQSSLGYQTTYQWNANRHLESISPRTFEPIHFEYDERHDEISRFIGEVRIKRVIDSRRRCVEQQLELHSNVNPTKQASVPIHRHYKYDAANNLTEVLDQQLGTTRYLYDSEGRIRETLSPRGLIERFAYDRSGNLLELGHYSSSAEINAQILNGSQELRYEAGNVLAERGDTKYHYDRCGKIVRKVVGQRETHYTWNQQGYLTRVLLPDGDEWTYHYDAFGRRVEKRGTKHTVRYVWDVDVILHEIHTDRDESVRITHWEFHPSGFAPVAKIDGEKLFLCMNDVVGVPRELISREGATVWAAEFTTLGHVRNISSQGIDCPVRFQGQWHDSESGLHYNRFRYYDPEVGRYISSDPCGLLAGLNSYLYGPNTTGWIDPFGLQKGPCRAEIIRQIEEELGLKPGEYEFFLHGTTDAKGQAILAAGGFSSSHPSGLLFFTQDARTANIFADRAVSRSGLPADTPTVIVVVVVPTSTAAGLRSGPNPATVRGQTTVTDPQSGQPITVNEVKAQPGPFNEAAQRGDIIVIPR